MMTPSRYDHLAAFKPTGDKHAVVLDIGSAFTRLGYASETTPRAIVPSFVDDFTSGLKGPLVDLSRPAALQRRFLKLFLDSVYYDHLIVEPKLRRVVVVESVLAPSELRQTLADILFRDYDVPSVLFAPSHLTATFPLGVGSALVLELGASEALAVPIFESVTMLNCWQASAKCGTRSLHERLRRLLVASKATLRVADGVERPVEDADLSTAILEDIFVRSAFATKPERGALIQAGESSEGALSGGPEPAAQGLEIQLGLGGRLCVPGPVREAAAEELFAFDEDDKGLAQLVLDALLMAPKDLRKPLAQRILLTGGGAQLAGLRARLSADLAALVKDAYSERLFLSHFRFLDNRCQPDLAGWLGGSFLGDLDTLPHKSLSKEEYVKRPHVPDWCSGDALDAEADPPPLSAKAAAKKR